MAELVLRRLNFHQNPAETLYIRRLYNGLARPGGRSGENLGHFSSLVVADAFAGALTRGSFKTIPASEETTNTRTMINGVRVRDSGVELSPTGTDRRGGPSRQSRPDRR